jgi:YidC/Oxa1 family membrane protein insertase
MDMYRAFLAIVISFVILIGYQYFFVPVEKPIQPSQTQEQTAVPEQQPRSETVQGRDVAGTIPPLTAKEVHPDPKARDITVETPYYTAVITEQGGGFKSFILKGYQRQKKGDTSPMQLVQTSLPTELPALFLLGNDPGVGLLHFQADRTKLALAADAGKTSLVMTATVTDQLKVVRTLVFDPASYLIEDSYRLENLSPATVSTVPLFTLTNGPFSVRDAASRFTFSGPVAYVNQTLHEVKEKKISEGVMTLEGDVSWAAYEDNYFICAVIPAETANRAVKMSASGETVRTVIDEGTLLLDPAAAREFKYTVYFGPKKLEILNSVNRDLAKAINFGWFDVLAKPMLWLLNFFHSYVRNYGIAIILLTVLIKAIFWPITQKGMKSMKNMQKLQPKVAKLKEKFKNDPQKMNQEMMALYKTYKVNPLGGCLPLLLQIPFFFALYKVLLMSIELRHAPFMLWINDLSAPDRLWIGIDIPFLHGIPVLTLLMGGSMYLQQKMTPTTADPTQARIMQMLPVIFTFMFLNFASGLVLYWFVNNLLSILQQQLINRQTRA